jgi:hypothetical protein
MSAKRPVTAPHAESGDEEEEEEEEELDFSKTATAHAKPKVEAVQETDEEEEDDEEEEEDEEEDEEDVKNPFEKNDDFFTESFDDINDASHHKETADDDEEEDDEEEEEEEEMETTRVPVTVPSKPAANDASKQKSTAAADKSSKEAARALPVKSLIPPTPESDSGDEADEPDAVQKQRNQLVARLTPKPAKGLVHIRAMFDKMYPELKKYFPVAKYIATNGKFTIPKGQEKDQEKVDAIQAEIQHEIKQINKEMSKNLKKAYEATADAFSKKELTYKQLHDQWKITNAAILDKIDALDGKKKGGKKPRETTREPAAPARAPVQPPKPRTVARPSTPVKQPTAAKAKPADKPKTEFKSTADRVPTPKRQKMNSPTVVTLPAPYELSTRAVHSTTSARDRFTVGAELMNVIHHEMQKSAEIQKRQFEEIAKSQECFSSLLCKITKVLASSDE